ncbi:hypothetical protein Pst134EA_017464 [Puccinia striiformis f. sp. tritici]|nr:hypothetical protein Pst134EA_017464 [Puccinia striiformis f. sp. tritici]KAH9461154.1 hypothetical protein Pst134EA_017464 [Puccinia striiformis f. sp. tritici]
MDDTAGDYSATQHEYVSTTRYPPTPTSHLLNNRRPHGDVWLKHHRMPLPTPTFLLDLTLRGTNLFCWPQLSSAYPSSILSIYNHLAYRTTDSQKFVHSLNFYIAPSRVATTVFSTFHCAHLKLSELLSFHSTRSMTLEVSPSPYLPVTKGHSDEFNNTHNEKETKENIRDPNPLAPF